MKIIYFYSRDKEQEKAKEALKEHECVFLKGRVQDHEEYSDTEAEGLVCFVDAVIDEKVFNRFPKLQAICIAGTGTDNINLNEAKKRNIVVCNVPRYGRHTVAEHAFGLLFSIAHKITEGNIQVRDHGFARANISTGFDLHSKVLGVIGTGSIGREVIKIAKALNMEVVAYDAYPNPDFEKELGFNYKNFDEVLSMSDVVTLHIPYMKETHHLIDTEAIEKMKKGSVLINTARGGVIDTFALLNALESGKLRAVGLDVMEGEDRMTGMSLADMVQSGDVLLEANAKIIQHTNVIVTPHIGAQTEEALERIFETTIENIKEFSKGNPQNVIGL